MVKVRSFISTVSQPATVEYPACLKITENNNSQPGLSRVILRQKVPGVDASKLMQSISALMLWSNGCHDGHDSSSLLSH